MLPLSSPLPLPPPQSSVVVALARARCDAYSGGAWRVRLAPSSSPRRARSARPLLTRGRGASSTRQLSTQSRVSIARATTPAPPSPPRSRLRDCLATYSYDDYDQNGYIQHDVGGGP